MPSHAGAEATPLAVLDTRWKCSCGKHRMPQIEVCVERGAVQRVSEIRRRLDLGRSCLLVHDANTRRIAGMAIAQSLRNDDCKVSEVIVDRPDETNVEKVVASIGAGDLLIGVGGTSVLDITKLAAHKKNVRYVLFSTGIANNGMGSSIASIYVRGKKETFPAGVADAIIVDLAIIQSAPSWMAPAGVGDLSAEATNLKDWELGHVDNGEPFCESIIELELAALDDIFEEADAIKSRTDEGIKGMVESLIRSGVGMTIWGSSRPASGAEHLWSHWLDHYAEEKGIKFGLHGEQIGIGTIIMAKYHELYNPIWWSRERYPNYQSEAIMAMLRNVGAPTTPSQIGIGRELAREAFLHAWEYRKERYTILHKRHPTRDDVEKIMTEVGM